MEAVLFPFDQVPAPSTMRQCDAQPRPAGEAPLLKGCALSAVGAGSVPTAERDTETSFKEALAPPTLCPDAGAFGGPI